MTKKEKLEKHINSCKSNISALEEHIGKMEKWKNFSAKMEIEYQKDVDDLAELKERLARHIAEYESIQ